MKRKISGKINVKRKIGKLNDLSISVNYQTKLLTITSFSAASRYLLRKAAT
jgi:hypothetical protein